jgi:hypothetical protein
MFTLGRPLTFVPFLVLLAGCTAAEMVDENFKPFANPLPVYLVPVAANGQPSTAPYVFYPPGGGSPWVSFDPYAPSSPNVNGTGIANMSQRIPPGDYFVSIPFETSLYTGYTMSPVFHHDYYTTCNDNFTGESVPCAPYYFQVHTGCETWQCVNGNDDPVPPSVTNGGYRVIPLISWFTPASPHPAPWTSTMQNDW